MYATAYNTSREPVTVDGEGRAIAPGEWGPVETTTEQVKDAVGSRALVLQDGIPDDGNPLAVAARDRTAELAERASALGGLDKDVLAETAADAGVPGAEDLHKHELVHALAHRDVEIPEPPAAEPASEEVPSEVAPEQPTDEPVSPEMPPRKAATGRRAGRGTE